jgi:hypothetical protein
MMRPRVAAAHREDDLIARADLAAVEQVISAIARARDRD